MNISNVSVRAYGVLPYREYAKPFCYQKLYVQSSKARFLLRLRNKNICVGQRSHQRALCTESVEFAQTIWRLGKALYKFFASLFSKSDIPFLSNYSINPQFIRLSSHRRRRRSGIFPQLRYGMRSSFFLYRRRRKQASKGCFRAGGSS